MYTLFEVGLFKTNERLAAQQKCSLEESATLVNWLQGKDCEPPAPPLFPDLPKSGPSPVSCFTPDSDLPKVLESPLSNRTRRILWAVGLLLAAALIL